MSTTLDLIDDSTICTIIYILEVGVNSTIKLRFIQKNKWIDKEDQQICVESVESQFLQTLAESRWHQITSTYVIYM